MKVNCNMSILNNYFNQSIRLIDTAGLRKKSKVDDDVEFYSTVRTQKIIQECDVALFL